MTETGGPYIQLATLCEKVLQEKDGVMSVIRVIDTLNIQAGAGAPEEMPAGQVVLTMVITLKAGMLTGKYEVKVVPTSPSGKVMQGSASTIPVYFEGNDRGMNLILNIGLHIKEEGVFWFDVSVVNQLLTRIPLRVVYQRLTHSNPALGE